MIRPVKTLIAALAAMAILPGMVVAEGALERLSTSDQGRGWEAVGRLNFDDSGFCTAALITTDVVLTAAHCLFDPADGSPIDPASIEFQAGLRLGRAEAYRGIKRVVVHPEYVFDAAGGARLDGVGVDLALLELNRPVRQGNIRPFPTQLRVEAGQRVQVVSYGRDRAEAPSRESACNVLARDAEIMVLSCEVDFGSSGAPVFAVHEGEARIVSVISAMGQWEGQDVSLAAVMEGQLETLIAEFAMTPVFAPVGKRITVRDALATAAR
ncbi:trypsin-like serine peptidase [Jannaschia rubra]|uniref:trypsin-like serine peptidase n=1 Tax=Jannaschia rubra TaxID=282197 RepID=UPI002490D957|nr:trypsin-like serine protease [Jannaschia rubra]